MVTGRTAGADGPVTLVLALQGLQTWVSACTGPPAAWTCQLAPRQGKDQGPEAPEEKGGEELDATERLNLAQAGFPGSLVVTCLPTQETMRCGFDPTVRKIPWKTT